ncbi:serine/threonine-protein kinase [Streptomyces sp. B1I3]|uniref:serine/threonine-protein kinase n=1 Tax=Streptomyces sp. B1I3 TaxID=3042264 RepID=UPI00277F5B2F|nr:serine/threonine-protein kinase [Streptomyces sp. B1I3]MDQ0795462.1 serine/threonine protein kinase [Streptomyces sp. B1I3]
MEKLGSGDPQRIGNYRLLGCLGAGGMGQVFLARSDRGRTVAIKLVRPELAEQQQFRDRFRAEVQAARQVGGPWTAPVLDADIDAAVPWVATGYVAGPALHRIVSGRPGAPAADSGAYGPLPERSVRVLGAGLASALQDIHRAGLVHRDLKPSNVLMTIDGPRVIDFGIARALETAVDGGLTRTGALIGSPGFMAPEQVRGERVTPACDVFCLGSVLAYAATGRLPFGGADNGGHALMYRIAQEDPDLTGVPVDLVELIRDCLAKDPAARPSTDAVLERLGAPETAEPWLPGALIAQLGRHAVELLDSEDPEGLAGPESGPQEKPATPPAPQRPPGPVHAMPTLAGPDAPPPQPSSAYPPQSTPQPAPQASYGYPQQPAPQGSYAYPPQPAPGYGNGYGPTPPYIPPAPHFPAPGPVRRRSAGSTVLLVAVALVVAIGAGWSVYSFMRGGDGHGTASPTPTASTTGSPFADAGGSGTEASGTEGPDPSPALSDDGKNTAGAIPADYVGSWSGSIDNGAGRSTRDLVIRQGEVGDTVLSLTAEGPLDTGGSYHCVFEAALQAEPASGSPVRIGPSEVTAGEPMTSCTPGRPTVLTLLPDGTLRREIPETGESLTYTKTG